MLERIFLKLSSFSDKLDLTNERLARLTELTVTQSHDTFSIKQRQNMLFKKQDIIHSTLAGEVDVHTPCSLSTSPAVAWCPHPNSPPFLSPPTFKTQVLSHPVVNKQQYYHIQHLPSHLTLVQHIVWMKFIASSVRNGRKWTMLHILHHNLEDQLLWNNLRQLILVN